MTAVDREPAPTWLTYLLAEHTFNHRGVCECGRISGKNPEYIRAHVAAVVWAEIERRIKTEAPYRYQGGSAYVYLGDLLDALGRSHE